MCIIVLSVYLYFLRAEFSSFHNNGFVEFFFTLNTIFFRVLIYPTIIFIPIVEFISARNPWPYLIFSSACGLALSFFFGAWQLYLVGVLGGIVAGFVYWFIAGRHAGLWRLVKTDNQR
jgi:hypothetical protein